MPYKILILFITMSVLCGSSVYACEFKQSENIKMGEEVICLAQNMYWEIRTDDRLAMFAVGLTVLNRVESPKWPNTVCSVVQHYKQRFLTLHKCQFSWYCDGLRDEPHDHEIEVYKAAEFYAAYLIHQKEYIGDFTNGANHYHSLKVSPNWNMDLLMETYRDKYHIFYKYK